MGSKFAMQIAKIKGNRIDIVTASRAEAYAITRERVMVIWEREGEGC